MGYLAGEIIGCLLLAFLTGTITGWALKSVQAKRSLKKLEKVYQINMASLESKKSKK
jgi:hypothetical protein